MRLGPESEAVLQSMTTDGVTKDYWVKRVHIKAPVDVMAFCAMADGIARKYPKQAFWVPSDSGDIVIEIRIPYDQDDDD